MANAHRGQVEVELAGEMYTLVFDYNAIAEIESAFNDKSIDEIMFSGTVSRKAIREALRAGLMRFHRKKTSKQVGVLLDSAIAVDPEAFPQLLRAIVRGLLGAQGVATDALDAFDQEVAASMKEDSDGFTSSPPDPTEGPSTSSGEDPTES